MRAEAKAITLLEAAENSYPAIKPQIFVVIKHGITQLALRIY